MLLCAVWDLFRLCRRLSVSFIGKEIKQKFVENKKNKENSRNTRIFALSKSASPDQERHTVILHLRMRGNKPFH